MHVAIYVVRSQRFRVLLPRASRPSSPAMFAIGAAHNLAAYVLPAKTGEVTLVMYLKALGGVPAAEGLAALFVSRLLDLATLFAALALAVVHLSTIGAALPLRWLGLAALLALGAAVLFALSARSDVLVRAAAWIGKRAGLARGGLGLKLLARAEDLALALRRAPAGRALWVAALQSLAMWALIFLFYGILARGFGLGGELDLARAGFGSSLAVLTNLLPINSFAGFGTQEGGWVLGFGLLGVPRDLALSTGLSVHLAQLASTVLLGALGHAAMGWFPRRSPVEGSGAPRVG